MDQILQEGYLKVVKNYIFQYIQKDHLNNNKMSIECI